MAELAAGAAVGLAFTLLHTAVNNLVTKTLEFKPLLEHLQEVQEDMVLIEVQEIKAKTKKIERDLKRIELRYSHEKNQSGGTRAAADLPTSSPVGLDTPLREIKMKLLHGDQVSMISITAPGGSGKTTLAQMVCHDEDVKDKFNNMIFFATVSRKPDLVELQNSLKIFLDETEGNAALLVLDDIWPNSSLYLLEELHELSQDSNYKILVTSRSSLRYGDSFPLVQLTPDEALILLKNSTSLDYSCRDLDELMEQIVRYCKRFPLAITVIGKSLFKESIEMWREKVDKWSKGPIITEHAVLLDCLQPSLDVLCEHASENGGIIKECFIDLASLPEDGTIPVGLLTDMWTELYSLSEDGSVVKLQQLNQHNLAKLIVTSKGNENVDSCYSEQFVTQHDMLRELALHQIRKDPKGENKKLNVDISVNDRPKQLKKKKFWQRKETRLLSISTDGLFSSKWDKMHLPKAVVMILNFQTKDYALPGEMPQGLKVLIVRNTSSSPAIVSNLEVMSSSPTLKRVRLERISISSQILNQKKLESLEKISLFMCYIAQPASTSSIQFFEGMPNLVEINIEYCNNLKEPPADICGLKSLKKLIITNCHNLSSLPVDIGNLINLEFLRLRCCTELETLTDSITILKNLVYLDISDCFNIKELPLKIGNLCKLKKFNMRKCERMKELPISIRDLENTLKEVICDEEIKELWEPFKMENLQMTVVKEEYNLRWLLGQ